MVIFDAISVSHLINVGRKYINADVLNTFCNMSGSISPNMKSMPYVML